MHYEDSRRHFYYFSSYLLLVFLTLIPLKMLLKVLLILGMFITLGKRLININQELKCSLWYVIRNNYTSAQLYSLSLSLPLPVGYDERRCY